MSAVTDPSIPTPEIPVSEARSFEGYVSAMPVEPQVAPVSTTGLIGWLRAHLFSSLGNSALTIIFGALAALRDLGLRSFALFDATWTGVGSRGLPRHTGRRAGACWPMITERLAYFTYGSYPIPSAGASTSSSCSARSASSGCCGSTRRAAISAPSISS